MKNRLLALLFVCLIGSAFAQDSLRRPVYVGVDLLKNVWPLLSVYPDLRSVTVVEPTVLIQLNQPHHHVYVTPGFARFRESAAPAVSSAQLSGQGYFLRVGVEKRRRRIGFGGGSIVTTWRDRGMYRLKGSYFGDYVGIIPPKSHVAVGGEGFVVCWLPLGKRFATRLQYRGTVLAPYSGRGERPAPVYLPGVGLNSGNSWKASSSLSAQLLYRISSTKQP